MPTQSFLRYIHNFRGLAILLIVIGHITSFIDMTHNSVANTFIQVVATNGSVYFVFIAGFLFQFLSRKYEYKNYLEKKIKSVVLPYLIISAPAIFLCLLKNQPFYQTTSFAEAFGGWSLFQKVIVLYLTGAHFFHLWFIPMIIIFYIFAPLFIWLDRHPKFYKVLPWLLVMSIVIPRPDDDSIVLQNFAHFLSVYVLGMFCCRYRDTVLAFMHKNWKTSLLAAITLVALETALRSTSSPLLDAIYINTASKTILSVVFIYFLWRFDSVFSQSFHIAIGRLADLSFGIYFLHGYVIYAWAYAVGEKHLGLTSWFMASGFVSLALSLWLVVSLTIAALLIIQRLFGKKSRYLIGC